MTSFDVPERACFTCNQCGDCCRGVQVLLDEPERARIAALDMSVVAPDLVGIETMVLMREGPLKGRHRLAHKADDSCIYLGELQQCRLHEHFGATAKPLMCRSYPFAFRQMGELVAVDVAFSCCSVSDGTGEPVRAQEPEWEALLSARPLAKPADLRLTGKQPVMPELAREIERVLIGLLGQASLEPPDRVRACADFLKLGLAGDPATPEAAMLRQAIAEGLPQTMLREPHVTGMDDTQQTVFRQWLYLALNPAHPSLLERKAADRSREEHRWRDAGIAFRDGKGRPCISGTTLGATFEYVERVDSAFLRASELPIEFLIAKLVGQRFLQAGTTELPLIEAARMLLLSYPMICWTAKALAADRESSSAEEADIRRAIRLIDRSLGQMTTGSFPRAQSQAFEWAFHETDLVAAAMHDVLSSH